MQFGLRSLCRLLAHHFFRGLHKNSIAIGGTADITGLRE